MYILCFIVFAGVFSINQKLIQMNSNISKMELYTRTLLEKSQRVENIIEIIKNIN